MSLNFSITKETKENTSKGLYPVKIHEGGNFITGAEYNEEFDCLDITFENDSYKHRERMFNPTKNVPTWTTPEKQLAAFQSRIAHYLRRFMDINEQNQIEGNTFQEMCQNVAIALKENATGKPFSLKLVYDKAFQYPRIPNLGRVIAVEGEEPLSYSKWEKENVLLPEVSSAPSNTDASELF